MQRFVENALQASLNKNDEIDIMMEIKNIIDSNISQLNTILTPIRTTIESSE